MLQGQRQHGQGPPEEAERAEGERGKKARKEITKQIRKKIRKKVRVRIRYDVS